MQAQQQKSVIITGAGRGIGFAFATRLAGQGYHVAIVDTQGAEAAAQKLRQTGGQADGYTADVTREADWRTVVAAVAEGGRQLYGLVNNAAYFASLPVQTFDRIPKDEWMRVMEVNTAGPFLGAREVAPHMRRHGQGRIVNMASTSAMKGVTHMLHYVGSKGAVIAMTRALARELGQDNITVNAIAPGLTLSDGILTNTEHVASARDWSKAARALKRDAQPEDLVGAVAFLLSEDARFMTGQTLVVDGGAYFV